VAAQQNAGHQTGMDTFSDHMYCIRTVIHFSYVTFTESLD